MKRELLIATILLAAGGMLWAGQFGGMNQAIQWVDSWLSTKTEDRQYSKTVPIEQPAFDSSIPSPRALDSTVLQLPRLWKVPDARKQTSDSQTIDLLETLATNLKNSSPFSTQIYIQLRWNDEAINIQGEYSQIGQGTGQARLDLQVINSIEPLSLTKICDGRFLYTVAQQAGQKQIEFVDLRRVQRVLSQRSNGSSANISNISRFGELSSLFQNLAHCFKFSTPKLQQIEGQYFCHVIGTWHPDAILQRFGNVVAQHHLEPEIVWHKLPPQIPHQVSLTLTQTDTFGWIPQRITFVRYPKPNKRNQSNTANDESTGPKTTAIPLAVIDFFSYRAIDVDAEELLKIDSSEVETIDITDDYLN